MISQPVPTGNKKAGRRDVMKLLVAISQRRLQAFAVKAGRPVAIFKLGEFK